MKNQIELNLQVEAVCDSDIAALIPVDELDRCLCNSLRDLFFKKARNTRSLMVKCVKIEGEPIKRG